MQIHFELLLIHSSNSFVCSTKSISDIFQHSPADFQVRQLQMTTLLKQMFKLFQFLLNV